jgi:enamine deaminase RidA (YjgF/YER057c/UK114 family)
MTTPLSPPEARLAEMGIQLGQATKPIANFLPAKLVGSTLYVSGHASLRPGAALTGEVGRDVTQEQAYQAAREVMIDMLGSARAVLGSLDRVVSVVKLLGMVHCSEDFTAQPAVINGASDLLVRIFGEEAGRHARSAIGVRQLPNNASVEIEMILDVK